MSDEALEPPQPRVAFISYVKEDAQRAIDLQKALEAAGIDVWRDKDQLWPGDDWKLEIRKAIRSGTFAFLACFSANSVAREATYQNEELILAVEEFRLRSPGTQWLFPVRWDEVKPPEFDLGAGRTVESLHYADLFGPNRESEMVRLATSVQRALNPAVTAVLPAPLNATQASDPATLEARLKTLLREPNGDIALEELVIDVAKRVTATLSDPERFPVNVTPLDDVTEAGWVDRTQRLLPEYLSVVQPLAAVFELAGLYGQLYQERIWTLAMQRVVNTAPQIGGGNTLLRSLRGLPIVYLMYVAGLAAVQRSNFATLRSIVSDPRVKSIYGKVLAPASVFTVGTVAANNEWIVSVAVENIEAGENVGDEAVTQRIDAAKRGRVKYEPIADYLTEALWPTFEDRFASREDFEAAVDDVEVFLTLVAAGEKGWAGGRFTYRHKHVEDPPEVLRQKEFEKAGAGWQPLVGGFFGGDADLAKAAFERTLQIATSTRNARW